MFLFNKLLRDIILCSFDTINERKKLLNPAFFILLLILVVLLFFSFNGLNINRYYLFFLLGSYFITLFLIKFLRYNFILSFTPLAFVLISFHSLFVSPVSSEWIIYQLLALVFVNFLGSTRCNFIIFFIIALSPLIFLFSQTPIPENFFSQQAIIYLVSPILIANSFYKTFFNIEHIKDIQEIYRLEKMVINKNAESSIAEIVSVVNHEINNALTALNGGIYLAKAKFNVSDEAIEKIDNAAKRIQDITLLVKKKSFVSEIKNEFNLSQLLKDELYFLRLNLQRFQINLIENIDDDVVLFGNETEFTLIISNIINNSRDAFLMSSSVFDSKDVYVTLKKLVDNKFELSLRDNAGGISKENQQNIFKKNFTTKNKGEGAGLGLYYVKSIIESYGLKIDVESSENVTTFKIYN